MKRNLLTVIGRLSWSALMILGLLSSGTYLYGQSAPIPLLDADTPAGQGFQVEILSDTRGVDLGPYIRQVIHTVSERSQDQQTTNGPKSERSALLTFTVGKDGSVTSLHLDQSSQDGELDRAAWSAIAQAKSLPSLPKTFTGSSLTLRIRYSASNIKNVG